MHRVHLDGQAIGIVEEVADGQAERPGNGRSRILQPVRGHGQKLRFGEVFFVFHRTGRLGADGRPVGGTQETRHVAEPAVQVYRNRQERSGPHRKRFLGHNEELDVTDVDRKMRKEPEVGVNCAQEKEGCPQERSSKTGIVLDVYRLLIILFFIIPIYFFTYCIERY